MSRPRPHVEDSVVRRLSAITSSSPEEYVACVLTSRAAPGRRTHYDAWSYGEIREAIRRALERPGADETRAKRGANLRTGRGLRSLVRKGAVKKAEDGRYHMIEEAALAETHVRRIREVARRCDGARAWKPSHGEMKRLLDAFPPGWQVAVVRGRGDYEPGYVLASYLPPEPASEASSTRRKRT